MDGSGTTTWSRKRPLDAKWGRHKNVANCKSQMRPTSAHNIDMQIAVTRPNGPLPKPLTSKRRTAAKEFKRVVIFQQTSGERESLRQMTHLNSNVYPLGQNKHGNITRQPETTTIPTTEVAVVGLKVAPAQAVCLSIFHGSLASGPRVFWTTDELATALNQSQNEAI